MYLDAAKYAKWEADKPFLGTVNATLPTPVKGLPLWEPKAVIEVRETMQGEVLIWHNDRAWIMHRNHSPSETRRKCRK